MVGLSQDAHSECIAHVLPEETPNGSSCRNRENDPRIQQLISSEVTDVRHACTCFGSSEDFLDGAGPERFDLLLLDSMLPCMDGLAYRNSCSSRPLPSLL